MQDFTFGSQKYAYICTLYCVTNVNNISYLFSGSLTFDNFNVTCDKQKICAVTEDKITVSYDYSNINIKTGFWFSQKQRTNWRNKDEPEDLTLDSDYSGRVKQWITEDNSYLIISDLRESDSGEYQVMFIMKDGVKHLSSVTVNLTVSVLQVKINPESRGRRVKLSCDYACPFTSGVSWGLSQGLQASREGPLLRRGYSWFKNGKHLTLSHSIFVSSIGNTNSYSCYPSSSVCLSNSSCWAVTYTSTQVCALVGSTVDIHSSYSHPTGYTAEKTYWDYYDQTELRLREDQQFSSHLDFLRNTLRIKDINMSDTGFYYFNVITNTSEEVSAYPGVTLTVTDTRVISSPDPVIDGEKVILSCTTNCTLDNKHTYIWYKNGQQVTDGLTLLNKLYLDSINSEELQEYSCTVRDSMNKTNETIYRNNEEMYKATEAVVYSSVFVSLLVFLPQFLIIGAVWIWFFISMNKLNSSKNKTDDKQIED
ncbi:uncharacterized protein [Misgurnus anguillicaudatus]|uniref:uncharacterized protein isoform X1 n=1 Tax=Misgurnus anguillicaudatus TaxID=75329 RepID=UPI003CCF8738